MDKKRLHKSSTDRYICGVCGGIGERFGIDSKVIRIIVVVFGLLGGSIVIPYIVAAILMPSEQQLIFEQQQEFRNMKEKAYDADYEVKE